MSTADPGQITLDIQRNCLLRRCGSPGRPTLILLAGFGDNGTMYLPLFQTDLIKKYQLLTIDLPGTGGSPVQSDIQTIDDYATLINAIIQDLKLTHFGLVGHSIASPITVAASQKVKARGLFSIEGNLTEADAYFSGRAGKFSDVETFWTSLKTDIRMQGADDPVIRRYYGATMFADAHTLWLLGKDAARLSPDDGFGNAYINAGCRTHYFWSDNNTPETTIEFIEENKIPNTTYNGSHWPTIDRTEDTASALLNFFDQCF